MWLTAVDCPFLRASWMLAGNKKGGIIPALFQAVRDESASLVPVSLVSRKTRSQASFEARMTSESSKC